MRIEITEDQGETLRHTYHFNTFDFTAVFVGFTVEEKPKGKRKWTVLEYWDKYMERNSTMKEPELPDFIKALAIIRLQSFITVKTWKEWKPNDK